MKNLPAHVGVILVDHGSKFDVANDQLLEVAKEYKRLTEAPIVEPAHMELAEPTIAQAFNACVRQGAREVIVHPYFLAPGRHSTTDIPRMVQEAAADHPGVKVRITPPLGLDANMFYIIHRRIIETIEGSAHD